MLTARSILLGCLAFAVLSGCSARQRLVEAPYVMRGEAGRAAFERETEASASADIPIVYYTDRRNEATDGAEPSYGAERHRGIEFGTVVIALEPELSREELLAVSTAGDRARPAVFVKRVEQTGAFASLLSRLQVEGDRIVYPPEAAEAYWAELQAFRDTLDPWLTTDDNAAMVFVHGFNNTFDGAAIRLAKTWHAAGRQGVPILYTWPAGYDAFKLLEYNHDRESGEFTVLNLKLLLLALAMDDRIDRVHLIAHSRGTDVATTALRELDRIVESARNNTWFAQLANGAKPEELGESDTGVTAADVLKLETLVLIAPDLDLEVFTQRFVAERSVRAARRIAVYSSPHDRAISLATFLFADKVRVGRAAYDDFDPRTRDLIGALPNVDMISCDVRASNSHSYLFEHPGALSDMILLMRDKAAAGADHGRPLAPIAPGFWRLDESYLAPPE